MPTEAQPIQRLRRGMVRRLPTRQELAHRRVIQITPRDRHILRSVYKHGFMTVEQIELAFFPPPASRTSPSSAAYDRVRQLWLWGYLERVELPIPRMLGGRQPCLFALGRRAVSVVAADLGKGKRPVHQRRLDRLDDQNIDHDLKAAAFWAQLRALARGKRVKNWYWTSERDLKAEQRRIKDPETNKWLAVLPDGEFRIVYPSGDVQLCFLEIDMDSMPEKRFCQKMRAFDLYLTHAMRKQGQEAWYAQVFVVTTSSQRMENLIDWTDAAVDENSDVSYFFGTFADLESKAFAGHPWRRLSREGWCRLLFNQAYEKDQQKEAS